MSKPIRFKVKCDLTGRRRTFHVYVHDTKGSFDARLDNEAVMKSIHRHREQVNKEVQDEAVAVTISFDEYELSDHVGEVHFRTDIPLTINTIAHEVTHVAITLYRMDVIQFQDKDTKASKHLSYKNELLPQIIGELTEKVTHKMIKRGVTVTT